jgi:RimJ/RimL family protein N-acetyltransferase
MSFFPSAPALETDRLRLRGHRRDDHLALSAMWADPEVVRFIGGKPSSAEESWSRLMRYAGHWPLTGFGYWAIEEKATGRYLGDVGLADFKRELAPPLDGTPEIGWALASWAHGKGLAQEAIRAVLAWADANLEVRRTVCLIAPEHAASIHLAEKFGYRRLGEAVYKGHVSLMFERWSVREP